MRSKLPVILIAFFIPLLSGCDILNIEAAAKVLGGKLDKSVQDFLIELRRVEMDATKESEEWRKLIDQVRKDFKEYPSELSTEGRAMIDFILARAKENTEELSKITEHLKNKEYATAMKLFLVFQKVTRSKLPPVTVNFSPKSVDNIWTSHTEFKLREDRQTLVLYGYNFHREENDKGKYRVEVRDKEGKAGRDESKHFTVSTNYIAQLDISANSGVRFKPEDATILFLFDGKVVSTAPVTFGERPPPPEIITKIRLEITTTRTKVREGKVTISFSLDGSEFYREEGIEKKCGEQAEGKKGKFEDSGNKPEGYAYEIDLSGKKQTFKKGDKIDFKLEHIGVGKEVDWGGNIGVKIWTDKRKDPIDLGRTPQFFWKNDRLREPSQDPPTVLVHKRELP